MISHTALNNAAAQWTVLADVFSGSELPMLFGTAEVPE
jgi:hypothetical protein